MDEFDEINPFGDEFRPDAPTPSLSPVSSPGPSTVLLKEQSQPSPGPSSVPLKEPPPPYHAFDDYKNETDEQIKKRLTHVKTQITRLTKKNDPAYKIKTSICGYKGYDLNRFETEEKKLKNIQKYRELAKERKQSLLVQLQEQKMNLKPTKTQQKREISPTPLEKAVMSRRPSVAYSDDDDDEQDFLIMNRSGKLQEVASLMKL